MPMHPSDSSDSRPNPPNSEQLREIKFRHSENFVPLLDQLNATLLVSTYAAGKVAVISVHQGQLDLSFHNFDQAMGIAVSPRRIAVGGKGLIWHLDNGGEIAARIDPPGKYQQCYLARSANVTGDIHIHEMGWVGDQLWVVNTRFSSLCTVEPGTSFVPRWKPPFISELAAEDRCHLNGLALDGGQPRFVTLMAESNEPAGWRARKSETGCVMDIQSNEVIARGLAMPHSPRVHDGQLLVLNSGCGTLEKIDRANGRRETIEKVPGYTRGLALYGPFAFVGMSQIRETAVFGGLPLEEERDPLRCGVAVIDLRSGKAVAYLEFEIGIDEVFDVQILPGVKTLSLTGPYPHLDGRPDVWMVGGPPA